ncbi:MAG: hypothetical protein ACYTG0_19455 [Planctomycetota bacterium]|jgi:hypothetical protein
MENDSKISGESRHDGTALPSTRPAPGGSSGSRGAGWNAETSLAARHSLDFLIALIRKSREGHMSKPLTL